MTNVLSQPLSLKGEAESDKAAVDVLLDCVFYACKSLLGNFSMAPAAFSIQWEHRFCEHTAGIAGDLAC